MVLNKLIFKIEVTYTNFTRFKIHACFTQSYTCTYIQLYIPYAMLAKKRADLTHPCIIILRAQQIARASGTFDPRFS